MVANPRGWEYHRNSDAVVLTGAGPAEPKSLGAGSPVVELRLLFLDDDSTFFLKFDSQL